MKRLIVAFLAALTLSFLLSGGPSPGTPTRFHHGLEVADDVDPPHQPPLDC